MAKLTTFLMGLIVISMLAAGITFFMADVSTSYSKTFDNSSLLTYNQLENLSSSAQSLEMSVKNDEKDRSGIADLLGDFFNKGYETMKLVGKSWSIFDTMLNNGLDEVPAGRMTNILKTGLVSMVLIFIFLGVIISAVVGRDL